MGRMLPRSERRENDFSTPFAALESSKYETGPTSTGTVSTPSCMEVGTFSRQTPSFTQYKKPGKLLLFQGKHYHH
jgi:hypothetical protein